MKKIITTLAIMFALIPGVFSQTFTTSISGTVIDVANGTPMVNQAVYIIADSSNFQIFSYSNTVYTDQNGYYSDTLVIPSTPPITFYVTTSDCNGAMSTAMVNSSNLPMTANFTLQCGTITCSAYYYAVPDSSNTGLSYTFYDQSNPAGGNITTWYWDFGDGANSNTQNPIHTYLLPGLYNVCLTIATDLGCTATYCDSFYADTLNNGGCQAWFQYTTNNFLPNDINFYGYSSDINSTYYWDFGDNTLPSTLQDPVHTYQSTGTYTVCLTIATSNGCTNTYCEIIVVGNPQGCPASFYSYPDSINYLLYNFINTSSGFPITSTFTWDFGDGGTSTLLSPSHLYAIGGIYNVCLYIIDSIGNINCSTCESIVADTSNTQGCTPYFQYAVSGNTVSFYGNGGSNIVAYSWSFGDGTASTLQNPVHQFGSNGTYYVCLTIACSNGVTSVYCDNVVVGNNLMCSAYFALYPDSITPHLYYAINLATGVAPISYLWSWGDGSTDTGPYPSHTYSNAGLYTICLTIVDATGCSATYCDSSYLQKNTNTIITINVIPSGTTGITDESDINNSYIIYPNPVNDNAGIDMSLQKSTSITVSIFNVVGQEMSNYQIAANSGMFQLPLFVKQLQEGIYSVQLTTPDGLNIVRKFIKIK